MLSAYKSCVYLSFFNVYFIQNLAQKLEELLNDEDIRNTWQRETLALCVRQPIPNGKSPGVCVRQRNGYENLDVEVFNKHPPVLRIANFVSASYLKRIEAHYNKSTLIESQNVEGHAYSKGHRGRRADGLWIEHNEPLIRPFFQRLRESLRINPAIAEEFLILKYEKNGHYAMHYDYLEPIPSYYDDGWYAYYGNRFATALLLVRTSEIGGRTVFPRLGLAVKPEPGDLLLWFNADSTNRREDESLHAACPIQRGVKMAISLWIRANFQDNLKCASKHAGYDWLQILRANHNADEPQTPMHHLNRPKIPSWVMNS